MELPGEVAETLALQCGVVARRQALALGLGAHDIRRLVRRREWASVHPGVYVDHTGPLTWIQRAWAAVLYAWPAALSHESALRAAEGPGRRESREATIHVVVDHARTVVAPSGVRVQRSRSADSRILWNLGPPRVRYEEAAIDVALDAQDDLAALGVLASAMQSRHTTARRLLSSLGSRRRVPRRDWFDAVLRDLAEGTCSVLEREFLTRVERAHGLPRGTRQPRATGALGVVHRDVTYAGNLVVELDGRLFPRHRRSARPRLRARPRRGGRRPGDDPALLGAGARPRLLDRRQAGPGAAAPGVVGHAHALRAGVPRRAGGRATYGVIGWDPGQAVAPNPPAHTPVPMTPRRQGRSD